MTDTPGIGHNQPPPDPIERMRDLVSTTNRWSAERPEIVDAEMAGVAQELLKQLRDNRDDLEAAMKAERAPFDLAIAAVRIRYRQPLELIGIAITRMRDKLGPWLKHEQDRLDTEAAERARLARDAAAQADAAREAAQQDGTIESELEVQRAQQQLEEAQRAAAKPARRARVRGDLSDRASSLRVTHFAIVVDEDKALRSYGKDPTVRSAALVVATRLASALARETKGDAKRCPAGFEFRRKEMAS
ncbi:MAG TPA: hypothetical protein VKY24_00765 [Reyranella sp.]|nr:hypothetical protein [Reyranella sp.]